MDHRDRGDVRHLHGGAGHHGGERVAAAHREHVSATTDEATWALTSYLVANAIILPMTGWLAPQVRPQAAADAVDVGLHPRIVLCGLAPNLASLVIFRIIQGATGGALQPLSQAVLLEAFKPEDRGKAMGFWGLGIVVAPILGPVFGGWVTENYNWRWVFYINMPVGAIRCHDAAYVFDPPYPKRSQGHRLLGHGHAGRLASARCSSCSTRGSRKTGSRKMQVQISRLKLEFELANLSKTKHGYWLEARYPFWLGSLSDSLLGRGFSNPQFIPTLRMEQVWFPSLLQDAAFEDGKLTEYNTASRFVHRVTAGFAYVPTPLVRFTLAYEYTWTNDGKSLGGVTNFLPARANEDHAHGLLAGVSFGF